MENQSERIVLKAKNPKGKLIDFCNAEIFSLASIVKAVPEKGIPHELIYESRDGSSTIHYIEDPLVKFSYIVIKGKEMVELSEKAKEKLEVYTREEIMGLSQKARTREEKMDALALLGVTSPAKFNETYFRLIEKGFTDRDPEVRRTAIWVTGYSAWPEFIPLLENLQKSDPDPSLQKDAGYLLAGFRDQSSKNGGN